LDEHNRKQPYRNDREEFEHSPHGFALSLSQNSFVDLVLHAEST
jgi:hypothetical protein